MADHNQKFWPAHITWDAWYGDYAWTTEAHGPLYYLGYDLAREAWRPGSVMDCPENTEGFAHIVIDYGYNGYLCPFSMASVTQPSKVLLFMDARQYAFAPDLPGKNPSSPASYYPATCGAFVHPNKTANCLFLDGHVQPMTEADIKNDSNGNFFLSPQRSIP
ncbi:MAG: hypothetical protein WC765_05515 [Phycisphaerae bacterium]